MIVVEPAAIFAEVNGARLLYVAMTRAVQELSLVHSEPLAGRAASRDIRDQRPYRECHTPPHTGLMARQLALLETRDDDQWRLDDSTRALGHKGVAQARRILHEALAAAREHDTAA